MEDNLQSILIFATNIRTERDRQNISFTLNENPAIQQWNIDQGDIDCVLRIVTETLSEEQIIKMVLNEGFICKILE